tara:strand:- start:6576 stop:7157 length:582 start_codon:yes stop_codon:yes gene_type:complete
MSYYHQSSYYKSDDLVNVIKNTRGKHTLPKATKGNRYLIISHYTNSFGTTKYIVLDKEGNEHFTTENSIQKVDDFSLDTSSEWNRAKRAWMDRTYIPVFAVHTYDYVGMPFVSSRDGNSRLVKPLFGKTNHTWGDKEGIWVHKSRVHDDDVKIFMSSSFPPDINKKGETSETVTFRVPVWFAEKKGLFDGNKS